MPQVISKQKGSSRCADYFPYLATICALQQVFKQKNTFTFDLILSLIRLYKTIFKLYKMNETWIKSNQSINSIYAQHETFAWLGNSYMIGQTAWFRGSRKPISWSKMIKPSSDYRNAVRNRYTDFIYKNSLQPT